MKLTKDPDNVYDSLRVVAGLILEDKLGKTSKKTGKYQTTLDVLKKSYGVYVVD
jgi:hypothetical protein